MSPRNTHSTEDRPSVPAAEGRSETAAEPDARIRPTAAVFDRQGIEDWLIAEIARAQGIDPDQIDVGESFIANGLNSAASVALVGDLSRLLGVPLSETLTWEYPSIAALAAHVAAIRQSPHDA